MPSNPLNLIVAVEAAVVVLAILGFLFAQIRGLRRIISALESKVLALRDTLKGARREAKTVREQLASQSQAQQDYGEMLETLIAATRGHHLTLVPDRDIVLDIADDAPAERRAAALRHAFLLAEKEAWLAAEGKEVDWAVLQGKLGQIIEFLSSASSGGADAAPIAEAGAGGDADALQQTIENQQRRIENLEKFKRLFLASDEKWRAASEEAARYHRELLAKGHDLGADAEFDGLLEKYNRVYADFGATFAERDESKMRPSTIEMSAQSASVGRVVIANQEEIQRLRNMAVDQHKMILRLREQLNSAQSLEQKDQVIAELHKQLERHERFMKESEQCTKQLEEELERMIDENHALKLDLQGARQDAVPAGADVEQMTRLIEDFSVQSSEMLTAIDVLESECSDLRRQLEQAGGADTGAMQRQLTYTQQQLRDLQEQYVELETRYLELQEKSL